jgi:hypothetical protein
MKRSLPWEAEIRSYTQDILLNEHIMGCIYSPKKHITLDGIKPRTQANTTCKYLRRQATYY